jgi:hypothetical protein
MTAAMEPQNQFSAAWIPPITAYCMASILMTLTNKFVLSGYQYTLTFLMLGVQVRVSIVERWCTVPMKSRSNHAVTALSSRLRLLLYFLYFLV